MKKILLGLILFFSSQALMAQEEFLGQCQLENGEFRVLNDKSKNIFIFKIESNHEKKEIVFNREYVWFWYEVTTAYWKLRHGKENGIFSWDNETGIGHLKYANREYFYWKLSDCVINESKI